MRFKCYDGGSIVKKKSKGTCRRNEKKITLRMWNLKMEIMPGNERSMNLEKRKPTAEPPYRIVC